MRTSLRVDEPIVQKTCPQPASASPRHQNDVYDGIQYLRGIAAVMVVFHHARHEFGGAMSIEFGALGVQIFFIISGFFIMHSGYRAMFSPTLTFSLCLQQACGFWIRRIIRVAPLYWITLIVIGLFFYPDAFFDGALLKDAAFIPHLNRDFPDKIWPILIPGWTLNYEMFFYLLFGVSFLLKRGGVFFLCVSVTGLSLLPLVMRPTGLLFDFYTNPVMLCFIAGVLLFWPIEALARRSMTPARRTVFAIGLIASFAGLLYTPSVAREVWPALCSALVVTTAALVFQDSRFHLLKIVGDASYSIYLLHLLSFPLTRKLLTAAGLRPDGAMRVLATFAAYVLIAVVLDIVIHYTIEKPLARWLRPRTILAADRLALPKY